MSQEASSARAAGTPKRPRTLDSPSGSEPATARRETYEKIVFDLYHTIVTECELPETIAEGKSDFLKGFPDLNKRWGYDLSREHTKFEAITHEQFTYSQAVTDPVFRILHHKESGNGVYASETYHKFQAQIENYDYRRVGQNGMHKDIIKIWCCYLDDDVVIENISKILQDNKTSETEDVFTVKYALVSWLYAAMGLYNEYGDIIREAFKKLEAFYEEKSKENDAYDPDEDGEKEEDRRPLWQQLASSGKPFSELTKPSSQKGGRKSLLSSSGESDDDEAEGVASLFTRR